MVEQAALLERYVEDVRRRLAWGGAQPEAQLAAPIDALLRACAGLVNAAVDVYAQATPQELRAIPDLAVHVDGLLVGFVELKAPGKGANPNRFVDAHDKTQWERLKSVPNLIYTDGSEWALYRTGERVANVDLPDVRAQTGRVSEGLATTMATLMIDFLSWRPIVPSSAEQLAEVLAPLCRVVRDEVAEALGIRGSALSQLAEDWRQVLFPEATDEQFADAYAQTLTYALLLARLDPQTRAEGLLTSARAAEALESGHQLLAQALRILTDPQARHEIATGVALLERAIGAVDQTRLRGTAGRDIWLYFYELFLGEYDPTLRESYGVYYTPVEVVNVQVRLVSQLLRDRFGKSLVFAEPDVVLLDPAVGTGTYLLAAVDHSLDLVANAFGPGAIPGRATTLARNVHAFEILVGPYTVAHLRLTQRLRDAGAVLPADGVQVYLTDTLEPSDALPMGQLPLFLRRLGDEHERARLVKAQTRVLVCLGNPPYRREAFDDRPGEEERAARLDRLLGQFISLARNRTRFSHLASLYNRYVYFWRWALWKVFDSTGGPGIVSFITESSYLQGPGFIGMREVMRRTFDELWIVDLEGGGLGARQSENVFAIRQPVAIAVGVRYGQPRPDTPAAVHYARITEQTRQSKLDALDAMSGFESVDWNDCPSVWNAPFVPEASGEFAEWPLLTDLFPWQQPGVKVGRTWPIATTPTVAVERWRRLASSRPTERAALFADRSFGRSSHTIPETALPPAASNEAVSALNSDSPAPPVLPYAIRSFQRAWILADSRLMRTPSQPLWFAHSAAQIYMASLLTGQLGRGPAATATANIPDLHYFRGSFGGKDIIPLWRDADCTQPNLTSGLLDYLVSRLGIGVTPLDLFAYCYALLAAPTYTTDHWEELRHSAVRIPLTADAQLFTEAQRVGRNLLELHTYGMRPVGDRVGPRPGRARAERAVSEDPSRYPNGFDWQEDTETLLVGGGSFRPVSREVWEYEVSGLKVLRNWLGYRKRVPAGRRSSPLDDIRPTSWPSEFTEELLELIWLLEATIDLQPRVDDLHRRIVAGPVVRAGELPLPEPQEKQPPVLPRRATSGRTVVTRARRTVRAGHARIPTRRRT